MINDKALVPAYKLVLIDEFQDFNRMEASIIDLLSDKNQIVIAGDDDQALYSQLRSASWDHIRAHYVSGHYDIFELPFCMRCPKVIVGAVNEIVKKAQDLKKLDGRIAKPYRYYEPIKGEDSAKYPTIDLVETSVQRTNANYFGRYIEQCIRSIPRADVESAAKNNEPVALIIGSNPYRRAVEQHLIDVGLLTVPVKDELTERQKALQILSEDPHSNLGWRIILSVGNQGTARERVRTAFQEKRALVEVISTEQRDSVLAEAKAWAAEHALVDLGEEAEEATQSVAVTSYEGSKGRSAQYVFLIAKKKCSVLYAKNAMGDLKSPSEFLSWIDAERFDKKTINAEYWNK
jgi:superfamily I DNA/RNA helicase